MGNSQSSASPLYQKLDEAMPPLSDYVWDSKSWNYVKSGGVKGAFSGERDRETFLFALSTVLAAAPESLLEDQSNVTFKLLFSRRADSSTSESISPGADKLINIIETHPTSLQIDSATNSGSSQKPSTDPSTASPTSWWKSAGAHFGMSTEKSEIMASLVALDVRTGRLLAKVQPPLYGRTQVEAFQCFRKDVERRLERVLARTTSALPEDDLALQHSSTTADLTEGVHSSGSPTREDGYEVPVGELFDVAPPSYEKVAATKG